MLGHPEIPPLRNTRLNLPATADCWDSMADPQKRKVDTRVVVETPEGVDFQFLLAGPGKRMSAWFVDWMIKVSTVFLTVFIIALMGIGGRTGAGLGFGLWLMLWFAVDWFYNSLFETWWNGQTPGKRSQQLRVVRSNGTPITATSAIGRNFLAAADSQPAPLIGFYTVGLLAMLCNRRMQRLGDLVFDTMVIDESRDWISRAAGLTLGIDPIPRSECTGRYNVPERTLAVIERLFEGDRIISDGRREEIARPLSLILHRRLGYEEAGPDPANPHIYFQQVPHRHTHFLRRILKTFADEVDEVSDSAKRGARSAALPGLLQRRRKPVAAAPADKQDRGFRLEDWQAEHRSGGTP